MESFERFSLERNVPRTDVLIVGGGIGGLSVARVLRERFDNLGITLLDKNSGLGRETSHSDHNTNIAHTGCFYPPGTTKALTATEGFRWLRDYHDEKGLNRRDVGKVVAGSVEGDEVLLGKYKLNAIANGQNPDRVKMMSGDELRGEVGPLLSENVTQGLYLQDAFMFDANGVMQAMEQDLVGAGVDIKIGHEVLDIEAVSEGWLVTTNEGQFIAKHVVNTAGTHVDKIARMVGGARDWKIIPVQGSYLELDEVAGVGPAIYEPTRKPPFLGVHIMPGENGKPFMGPDVFASLARDHYDINPDERPLFKQGIESLEALVGFATRKYPHIFPNADFFLGMLGSKEGRAEVVKHFSKTVFAKDVQRLIDPNKLFIDPDKLRFKKAGIRAQALSLVDGSIMQDMFMEPAKNPHNADLLFITDGMPGSPGFTASVGKARWLVRELVEKIAA